MAVAHAPEEILPGIADREDIGQGARYWTFLNSSPYYVMVRFDWAESSLDAQPDHVIAPYQNQRVTTLSGPKDRVCWQASEKFPRAQNPTGSPERFGFVATDSPIDVSPASVLSVGLQEQISSSSTTTLTSLESLDQPAGTRVVALKQGSDSNYRFALDNAGLARSGGGGATEPSTLWEMFDTYIRWHKGHQLRSKINQTSGTPDNPNEACWRWNGASWENYTADSNTSGSENNSLGGADTRIVYIGHSATWGSIVSNLASNGSGGQVAWEYWDGAAWTLLPSLTQSTNGAKDYLASGTMTWSIPTNWTTRTLVNLHSTAPPTSESLYWIRHRVFDAYSTSATMNTLRPPVTSQTGTVQNHLEGFNSSDILRFILSQDCVLSAEQMIALAGAPSASNHLTRKDYVDGQISGHNHGGTSQTGWTTFSGGGGFSTASGTALRQRTDGMVEFRGWLIPPTSWTPGVVISTLGTAHRPATMERGFSCKGSSDIVVQVRVRTNGEMAIYESTGGRIPSFIYLNEIMYPID